MLVALVKRDEGKNSAQKAIELCDGFRSLKQSSKILIKPNLVFGDHKKNNPPFGIVTTSRVIEELVQLLKDKGCRDIVLGEGSIISEEAHINAMKGFAFSGIKRVARKYGIKMIDFDKDAFEKIELDGHKFDVARAALDADFLINVPVLKTHGQTKVSLGMKNLKGCLKFSSKKAFHTTNLEKMIARLNQRLHSHLTIIDGTYALANGPITGRAWRKDLLIASEDVLSADIVGAAVLGKVPSSITHLIELAKAQGRSLELDSIEVRGVKVNDVSEDLPWEFELDADLKRFGVQGIRINYPENPESICSPCATHMVLAQLMFAKDNPGLKLGDMEVCIGGNAKGHPGSGKCILFGDCAIKSNKGLANAIEIRGCPPKISYYFWKLMDVSLAKKRVKKLMYLRIAKLLARNLGIYHEDFGLWEAYKSPEFDLRYFD